MSALTTAAVPAELRCARASVRDVFAIVRDLGDAGAPLWPRGILAELERRRGEFVGISTVDHALGELRRLGAVRRADGYRACEPPFAPQPHRDRQGRQRARARLCRQWRAVAEAVAERVERLRGDVALAARVGVLTAAEAEAAFRALGTAAGAMLDPPGVALPGE